MYTKDSFFKDVCVVSEQYKARPEYWFAQYDLYVLDHRGPVMHDLTLSLMSGYEDDQFVPPTDTLEELLRRAG